MECDYAASENSFLKVPKRTVHDKVKNFECMECDTAFSQKGNLENHKQVVHDKAKNSNDLNVNIRLQ